MTGHRMKTYSLAEVREIVGAPSERWVVKRVRNGTFPARKVGRDVRFTEGDVTAILDACAYKPSVEEIESFAFVPQLSDRSKKRAS